MVLFIISGICLVLLSCYYLLRSWAPLAVFEHASSKRLTRDSKAHVLPKRILNPANLRAAGMGLIWRFEACEAACQHAQALNQSRVEAKNSLPLPLSDCGKVHCSCRYLPMRDLRIRARRKNRNAGIGVQFEQEQINRRIELDRRQQCPTRKTAPSK